MAVVDQPAAAVATAPESALTASGLTGETFTLRVLKGVPDGEQAEVAYQVPVVAGMVVLDAVHYVQHNLDTDLACRWNCKAAKCGSCSAEVNGRPRLMCKSRVDAFAQGGVIHVRPMKAFPIIKDLLRDRGRRQRLQSAARAQPVLRHLAAFGSTTRPNRSAVSSRGGQNRQNRLCRQQESPQARQRR